MDKLKMHTPDLADDNFRKLAAMFPNAVTEVIVGYDENGNDKEITFGTSRELKEKAFLRLTVMPVRGVLEWSEVNYDELPAAVQGKYTAPEF